MPEETLRYQTRKILIGGSLLLLLLVIAGIWWRLAAGVASSSTVIFLQPDGNGVLQIATLSLDERAVKPLTTSPTDLQSFAVGPEQAQIAYVRENSAGDSEIWLLDWQRGQARNERLVHQCVAARCSRLVWHPDGRRLVLEHRAHETPNRPQLLWLDVATGARRTLLADETAVSEAASFSADGDWLAYASLPQEALVLFHLAQETVITLPMQLPAPVAWHPTTDQILFSELDLVVYHGDESEDHLNHTHDFDESTRIFLAAPGEPEPVSLTRLGNVDEANPAWSPDGEWIVFGRRVARTNTGRQLWLLPTGGGEARPLTNEPLIHHGPAHWSADGRFLLFQRFDTSQPQQPASIWLLEIANGEMEKLVDVGYLPAWLHS